MSLASAQRLYDRQEDPNGLVDDDYPEVLPLSESEIDDIEAVYRQIKKVA